MPSSQPMILKLIICLEILILVAANLNDGSRHRYCGTHLRQTLSFFCKGRYESMTEKRSGEEIDEYAYINDQPLLEDSPLAYASFPFLAQFSSSEALRPRVRRDTWLLRRGVVDECCRKPCTFQELKRYCKASESEIQIQPKRTK